MISGMAEPTSGATPSPLEPSGAKAPKPLSPSNAKYAFLLKSPFAQMFRATGAMPTVKEIRAIINGILKEQINEIKRSDKEWKKTDEYLKRVIRGDE